MSDLLDAQMAHNEWATERLLDACSGLSREQFDCTFEIGIGSLHDSFVHIVGAMWVWTDTLGQRTPRPWIDEAPRRTVEELRAMHRAAAADLASVARLGPMEQELTRERQGQVNRYQRQVILGHVLTHAMHHRAQMINMLRRLGVSPLPQSSMVEWSRAGCPAR
jgi:uncharacterized damage-inducible protein DinB